MNYFYKYNSPLGEMTMISSNGNLAVLAFDGKEIFKKYSLLNFEEKNIPVFKLTAKWLNVYFSKNKPEFTPPLALIGSDFEKEVWSITQNVTYGKTSTYGKIAAEIAKRRGIKKMSSQAVGNALGHNPVAIIIPCHRVIGSDGKLTGYSGGIDKKAALLELESKFID